MVNLINNVKNKAIEIKDTTVNFWQDHKIEIIEGAITVVATSFCIYFRNTNNEKNRLINEQENTINILAKEVNQLKGQTRIKDAVIQSNHEKIKFLEDLCERKDQVMRSVMSDGLRYGSPLCAQQMGYKAHQKA